MMMTAKKASLFADFKHLLNRHWPAFHDDGQTVYLLPEPRKNPNSLLEETE